MITKSDFLLDLEKRAEHSYLNVYSRFPVAFVRGEGRYLYDDSGKNYLDFAGGIAVNCLGHAHPRIVETISEQANQLIHISNLYYSEPPIQLAERLVELFGAGRCFFANSGAEANEGLYKMARRYGRESGKYEIITCLNSFHGRTLGGIAATGQEKIKVGFHPIVPGFQSVPFNDLEAIRAAITPSTSAVLIEGIQGEGGITPATPEFLLGLRRLCDDYGLLLFVDAVQCGHFRSGRFQSYHRILEGYETNDPDSYFQPDAVSFAKALGAGFPIGGFWVREDRAKLFDPGSHGTTYGGSPLACAVANAVLDVIDEENLISNIREMGEFFKSELNALVTKYPNFLKEVRGYGLILGLELRDAKEFRHERLTPAQLLINKLLEHGLLVVPSGQKVLRFLPAYNIDESEVLEGIEIIDQVLSDLI